MMNSVVMQRSSCLIGPLAAAVFTGAAAAQPCVPGWEIIDPGPDGIVFTLEAFSEASRDALFAGGWFRNAGGLSTGSVARWDGSEWSAVGEITWDPITHALMSFDDGNESYLYVGGRLDRTSGSQMTGIARWDGSQWSSVGTGLVADPSGVVSFTVHEGELHAGGYFWIPAYGEHGPRNLARWTGVSWEPVGGWDQGAESLISFNDGSGTHLYLTTAISPSYLARWDGANWSDARGTWESLGGEFVIFDDGEGDTLYLAGVAQDGSSWSVGLFRWDESDWTLVGATDTGSPAAKVWDDGTGPALYLGGSFSTVNGAPIATVARWDGSTWFGTGAEVLGQSLVQDFAVFDDGSGPALYAGGHFDRHGSIRYLARYRTCNHIEPCYANCDGSTTEPMLTVDDFTCFINEFAAAQGLPPQQQIEHYANCDGSTTEPILTVDDFTCFINAFAQGCP